MSGAGPLWDFEVYVPKAEKRAAHVADSPRAGVPAPQSAPRDIVRSHTSIASAALASRGGTNAAHPGYLIVIGTSAGGVPALRQVVRALPAELNAAVCIVMHIPTDTPTYLDDILQRENTLPVSQARDGQDLVSGGIIVGRTDHHLLIDGTRVRLSREERTKLVRPSIDGLFRTAARSYGPRAIGVILTGMLDDGTAGLRAIKDLGGTTIVQSPEEAAWPMMPRSAIEHVRIDHTLSLYEIAPALTRLVNPSHARGQPEWIF